MISIYCPSIASVDSDSLLITFLHQAHDEEKQLQEDYFLELNLLQKDMLQLESLLSTL